MDEIRIGVAGLGHRGLHWIRLLQKVPGYRITAIYDWIEPLQERALAEIAYREDVRVFGNYYDFLAYEGMDAVGLVVRQLEQGTMAAEALEAGKHVNSEVPAAYTMEECWRIVTNVERTGLVYSLAEQTRFWGFVDGWKTLVDDGMLGRITYAEGQYLGYYGTHQWFQDFNTGKQYPVEALSDHPEAEPASPQLSALHYLGFVRPEHPVEDPRRPRDRGDGNEHHATELYDAGNAQRRYPGGADEDGERYADPDAERVQPAQAERRPPLVADDRDEGKR